MVKNDDYVCPGANVCGCPRCSWIRIKDYKDNEMMDLKGDKSCATGDYDGVDADNRTCWFNPGPPITPVVNNLIKGSIAGKVIVSDKAGDDNYDMGASCIIVEQNIALPDDTPSKKVMSIVRAVTSLY